MAPLAPPQLGPACKAVLVVGRAVSLGPLEVPPTAQGHLLVAATLAQTLMALGVVAQAGPDLETQERRLVAEALEQQIASAVRL